MSTRSENFSKHRTVLSKPSKKLRLRPCIQTKVVWSARSRDQPHVAPSWPRRLTHSVVCAGAARWGRSALLIGGGSRAPLLTSFTAFRRYRPLVASGPFISGRCRLSVVHVRLVHSFFQFSQVFRLWFESARAGSIPRPRPRLEFYNRQVPDFMVITAINVVVDERLERLRQHFVQLLIVIRFLLHYLVSIVFSYIFAVKPILHSYIVDRLMSSAKGEPYINSNNNTT